MLQMFGLSWLVAPGEAEAQCGQLDTAGLTEGTITDDSDIWYVEFFSKTELVQHFGLTRDKLVCVALMTGSDYTEGWRPWGQSLVWRSLQSSLLRVSSQAVVQQGQGGRWERK